MKTVFASTLPLVAAACLAVAVVSRPASAAPSDASAASVAPASRSRPVPHGCELTPPDLYDRISPAVVSIMSASINPYDGSNRIERRTGSGVIVDATGLVLTNSHVVYGAEVITVTLDDGTTLPGHLVGADPVFDIAYVRIRPPADPLPVARLGDSNALRVGDEVYAIGNPFGLEQTLTRGIVSAVNRVLPGAQWSLKEPLIQTDAAINPGNSGGPLVNRCGDVVGLTTAILPDAQSIGFAVPAGLIRAATPDLLEKGRVVRPWVGVQGTVTSSALRDLFRSPLPEGLLVEVVEPGSPAAAAGVRGGDLDVVISGSPLLVGGDVITAIDGKPVGTPERLAAVLSSLHVGECIHLTIAHVAEARSVDLFVPERPLPRADSPGSRVDDPATGVSARRSRDRFVPARAAF